MVATFSTNWTSGAEPFMRGLKLGGLMNQSILHEDSSKQGRHHFMTALTQIMEWSLALEQISTCLQAAHISYSFTTLNMAKYVVPISVTYLASRQIEVLHMSEAANFVQKHLGKLSLIATVIATVALFVLGHRVLAVTTLIYLSIGVLDRYNVLPESIQKVIHHANFIIGNFTGLYFGGKSVRFICTLNLVITAVEHYFKYKRQKIEPEQETHRIFEEEQELGCQEERNNEVSWNDLLQLSNDSDCSFRLSHIDKKILPSIREDVCLDDIINLSDKIDWTCHEHVLKSHLAKDKRWLEVGRFKTKPIEYFKRNLRSLVDSIKYHNILEGKPQNYEMLERYTLYIAQELQEQDEITQADFLILLSVEGGEYCGPGKFQIVEEIYGNFISQAAGLPLELRMLACLQQERLRVWQQIYELIWKTNPIWQLDGYLTDSHAVHNANLFINLIGAGSKFGIPCQSAQNDRTAIINPAIHYLVSSFADQIEDSFWKKNFIPQCYVSIEKPEGRDQWKAWKWFRLNTKSVSPKPYNQQAILDRLDITIGTAQIPKSDIYSWWQEWVMRQNDLSEDQKEALTEELSLTASLNDELLEVKGKIQPKFLIAMLIEMGVFDKPEDMTVDEQFIVENLQDDF